MTDQPTLPFSNQTTSKAAAVLMPEKVVIIDRLRVLLAIESSCNGLTDEEGCDKLDMPGNTYRPRRGSLHKQGLIRYEGTRKTKSGRQAVVWYVKIKAVR